VAESTREALVATLVFMDEATSVGAAIAVGVGIFPDIEEAVRIVHQLERTGPNADRFPVYRKGLPAVTKAYEQLAPAFGMLAEK
jgi:sugar (pentulose or hexulose) kinase